MYMPKARGFRYIVVAKDDLSGATEARALRKATARSLATFFYEQLYCRYGAVGQVTTDNGAEVKEAFGELMTRLSIPHVKISPYNSRANGVVERGRYILRESLVKACEGNLSRWPELLPVAVFSDKCTYRAATGRSPFFLLHACDPILPFDLSEATFMVTGWKLHMTPVEMLALRIRQIEKRPEDIEAAAETLRKARFRSKDEFERKYQAKLFRDEHLPDALVLVRNTRIEKELSRKAKPKWLGPYAVVRRTKGGSYVLRELSGEVSAHGVAAFRLLPYISRDDPILDTLADGFPDDSGPMNPHEDTEDPDDMNVDSETDEDV